MEIALTSIAIVIIIVLYCLGSISTSLDNIHGDLHDINMTLKDIRNKGIH